MVLELHIIHIGGANHPHFLVVLDLPLMASVALLELDSDRPALCPVSCPFFFESIVGVVHEESSSEETESQVDKLCSALHASTSKLQNPPPVGDHVVVAL